jgi:hypothetical protein
MERKDGLIYLKEILESDLPIAVESVDFEKIKDTAGYLLRMKVRDLDVVTLSQLAVKHGFLVKGEKGTVVICKA